MNAPKKIALLGFDCALTPLVRKHIEEGIAPNFKKVFENGTVAENCLVPFPTITPPNWTAMATGAWPGTNNVTDFWRHVPGTTPEGANAHSSFNWDYVQSESFWEAAEKIGKKTVVLNYPMSYNAHKKLKHGTVVGGASLTVGSFIDSNFIAQYKGIERTPALTCANTFSEDTMVSTGMFPGNCVRAKFTDAEGWSNVPAGMDDDPLEFTYEMPFSGSLFNLGTTYVTWHILVRDLNGKGYDTVTVSPSKNFNDAFFTIKQGEWSQAFNTEAPLEKGGSKTVRLMAKLLELDDEVTSFRLYFTSSINIDGEAWCFPQEKAARLNQGNNTSTNNTGMQNLQLGWYDLDTWLEQIGIHYSWMGDTAEALLSKSDEWDIFYTHAHPTDYIYHVLMTDLDPNTCSSKQAYEKAWEMHRELYRHADRYLGRLLKLFDDETLVVLVSDHGATPDGPSVDPMDALKKAGLTYQIKTALDVDLEGCPENLRSTFEALSTRIDTTKSKAMPQRMCYVYVNLKGRDPEGIVEPEDYQKVQREIIDALMTYVHPKTGKRPFIMALPKQEAAMIGLWGDQVGDVVYAVYPEYSMQHGAILPTSSYGIGDLRTLCVYYGPKLGIKQGFDMQRRCNIVDLVPTFCYLTGWPLPKDAEGSVVYQVMEDPNFRP